MSLARAASPHRLTHPHLIVSACLPPAACVHCSQSTCLNLIDASVAIWEHSDAAAGPKHPPESRARRGAPPTPAGPAWPIGRARRAEPSSQRDQVAANGLGHRAAAERPTRGPPLRTTGQRDRRQAAAVADPSERGRAIAITAPWHAGLGGGPSRLCLSLAMQVGKQAMRQAAMKVQAIAIGEKVGTREAAAGATAGTAPTCTSLSAQGWGAVRPEFHRIEAGLIDSYAVGRGAPCLVAAY